MIKCTVLGTIAASNESFAPNLLEYKRFHSISLWPLFECHCNLHQTPLSHQLACIDRRNAPPRSLFSLFTRCTMQMHRGSIDRQHRSQHMRTRRWEVPRRTMTWRNEEIQSTERTCEQATNQPSDRLTDWLTDWRGSFESISEGKECANDAGVRILLVGGFGTVNGITLVKPRDSVACRVLDTEGLANRSRLLTQVRLFSDSAFWLRLLPIHFVINFT